jgi:membrane protein required for colicin V production
MSIHDFGWIDIVVLLIMFLSIIFGMARGFVRSFLSLFRLICTITFSAYLVPIFAPWIKQYVGQDIVANYLSFILSFITLYLSLSILNHFILLYMADMHGGSIDRALGVTFGLLRGSIIVVAMFIMIMSFTGAFFASYDIIKKDFYFIVDNERVPSMFKNAKSYNLMLVGGKSAVAILPRNTWLKLQAFLYNKPTDIGLPDNLNSDIKNIITDDSNIKDKTKKLKNLGEDKIIEKIPTKRKEIIEGFSKGDRDEDTLQKLLDINSKMQSLIKTQEN